MLVEINLLPKKHQKKNSLLLLVIILVLLFLSGFGFFYHKYRALQEKEVFLHNQLNHLTEKLASEQKKLQVKNDSNTVTQLQAIVNWADDNSVETVPLLQQLTNQLPERGFVQSFEYNEDGSVSLSVQFDSSVEAAHYLARLKNLPYFSEIALPLVETADAEEKAIEVQPEGLKVDKTTDNYLPRYIAHFELKTNKAELLKLQEEDD